MQWYKYHVRVYINVYSLFILLLIDKEIFNFQNECEYKFSTLNIICSRIRDTIEERISQISPCIYPINIFRKRC